MRWIEAGLVKGAQLTPGAPWRIQLGPADVRRLTATDVPEGWLSLKKAALALGVSQQTVVQRLKAGTLEGVRVRRGRRSGWRVRAKLDTYGEQPALFRPAPLTST
jgi:excisionase family DNA binding protein